MSDDIDVPVNAWEKAPDPKQLDARLPRRHRMIVRAMRRQLERRVRRGQDLFRDRP